MIDQEFVEHYLSRLIIQYQDKPKAVGEMTAFLEESSMVFDIMDDFFKEFDLDTAWGHRLDIIGKVVGVSRIVENAIAKTYFGWDDGVAPNPATFSEGPLFDGIADVGYTDTQLDDRLLRFFIRAKIAKNICCAYMAHASKTTLQDVVMFLFESMGYVVDNYDMTLTLYIDQNYDENKVLLLQAQNLLPKPQAVRYRDGYIQYNSAGTFGFSENPYAQTFGMGSFANQVI